jgi:predicted RNase H-like HicB family nuclease
MDFTVNIYKDEDGGFWAEVPELPGCITQGDSIEELEENAKDAIEAMLEGLIDDYIDGIQGKIEFAEPNQKFVLSLSLHRSRASTKA